MVEAGKKKLHDFLLQLGDNSLVIGHRLSEWCGHGPALEQDIALSNIALDHVGQARMYYQLAASMDEGKTEDDYAYRRTITEYKNLLILEQENNDFGWTIARSFYYDHFHILLLEALQQCGYKSLEEIAAQAVKEVRYHCRYSADWIRRLGDGTEESHQRVQSSIDELYAFTGEFFNSSEADLYMAEEYGIDITSLHKKWHTSIQHVLTESTLETPTDEWFHKGGKTGFHTEPMGFLLAELQYVQRTFPNLQW